MSQPVADDAIARAIVPGRRSTVEHIGVSNLKCSAAGKCSYHCDRPQFHVSARARSSPHAPVLESSAMKVRARLDLRLYIYPDGHGNIHLKTLDTGEDRNQPVPTLEQAMEAFRAIWEHAQRYKLDTAPQAPDEE